jgi:hypothetical protein
MPTKLKNCFGYSHKEFGKKFEEGGSTEEERFPRVADDTGKGISVGWIAGDGDAYFETEKGAKKYAKEMGYKNLQDAYDDGAIYYTEWDESEIEDQGFYYTADGEEVELEEFGHGGSVGDIYVHKHIPTCQLEILEYTNKGVKGLQKDKESLSKKERTEGKIVFYSLADFKDLFTKK